MVSELNKELRSLAIADRVALKASYVLVIGSVVVVGVAVIRPTSRADA